jgi:hypothetical protein
MHDLTVLCGSPGSQRLVIQRGAAAVWGKLVVATLGRSAFQLCQEETRGYDVSRLNAATSDEEIAGHGRRFEFLTSTLSSLVIFCSRTCREDVGMAVEEESTQRRWQGPIHNFDVSLDHMRARSDH